MASKLPEAIIEAWDSDTPGRLGGLMELAGLDPEHAFRSRPITGHPWLGLDITFPFPEIGTGRIIRCIIHPRGALMFDVGFADPVPPFSPHGVTLRDRPEYYSQSHRLFAKEILELVEMGEKDE